MGRGRRSYPARSANRRQSHSRGGSRCNEGCAGRLACCWVSDEAHSKEAGNIDLRAFAIEGISLIKITIVTISFNQARFLDQAIKSVLEQDYPLVEYIVVDPGSTDGSREIIEGYRSSIDHIIFDRDEGPADGLNRGFSMAKGQIFGFRYSDL